MQRIFIVHAHPEPLSFTTAMKNEAVAHFSSQGAEVRIADLYEIGFNPVASAADFTEPKNPDYLVYALEQRHAYTLGTLAPDIAEQVDNVLWADLIIFSFPIYWFSVPAILKGWIDRVLLSGPFYGGLRFYDQGGLSGKTALVAMTLGGQSHMFGPDAVHGELELMLSHFLRGTLGYLGLKVLEPFVGYHVPYISPEEREQIMMNFRDDLATLNDRKCLEFTSLKDFDAQLRPVGQKS